MPDRPDSLTLAAFLLENEPLATPRRHTENVSSCTSWLCKISDDSYIPHNRYGRPLFSTKIAGQEGSFYFTSTTELMWMISIVKVAVPDPRASVFKQVLGFPMEHVRMALINWNYWGRWTADSIRMEVVLDHSPCRTDAGIRFIIVLSLLVRSVRFQCCRDRFKRM